jgi:hypothetical protein
VGQVADPGSPGGRIVVTVNRHVDILEDELSHNRIDEAEYQVGRIAQFAFERARGKVGTSNWQGASRVDAYTAKELAVMHNIENAERITRMIEWWRRELGRIDANILERVLGEGKSYAEVAALQGKGGDRGARYIANRFRDALKALAELKSAKGLQATRRPA